VLICTKFYEKPKEYWIENLGKVVAGYILISALIIVISFI